MLKIGIDVDSVLADFKNTLINFLENKYYVDLTLNHFNNFKPIIRLKNKKNEYVEINVENEVTCEILPNTELLENMDIIDNNIPNYVNQLYQNNIIYIITSRPSYTMQPTIKWLNKHKIPFHAFIIGGFRKANFSIDILVDDKTKNILGMVEEGKLALIYDYPWNREIWDEIGGAIKRKEVHRFNNWKQIYRFLTNRCIECGMKDSLYINIKIKGLITSYECYNCGKVL
jgi:uncharacterized HAD superfamily protein